MPLFIIVLNVCSLFIIVLNVCSVSEHFTSHAMFIMPLFTIVLDCVCSVSEHFTSHAMFIMPPVSAEEQYIYHFSLLDLICVQLFRPDSCPLFVPFNEVKSGLGEEKEEKSPRIDHVRYETHTVSQTKHPPPPPTHPLKKPHSICSTICLLKNQ